MLTEKLGMAKLIECVPNFSEGRDLEIIEKISKSIRDTKGCSLLYVDPGESTNRTVYTFVGNQTAVVDGAYNAALAAYQSIDMTKHKGEHPRFGAMDVCPFIPIRNATIEDCIECSHKLAEKMANELHIPVYLYALSAKEEKRIKLPTVREGEYEKLPEKLKNPEWTPDYGPSKFDPRWGATAVGARKFLIAYNVNLISTKEQAHKIALNIRESGRGPNKSGRLKCVQSLGWYLEEHNLAQVSVNITDCDVTKVYQVYEEVCKDAKKLKLPVLGSEIIGLIPLQSIIEVAEFYINKEQLFVLEERSKIQLAIHKLGLSQLKEFDPNERIIEYIVEKENSLTSRPLSAFISSVARRTPTPGGGSVSAAVASMGAALCTMTGQMTYGRKKWEHLESTMRKYIPPMHECMVKLLPLIDQDSTAFNSYMIALKMPTSNEEESEKRKLAMQHGILEAINVPLKVMQTANQAWDSAKEIAVHGNTQCLSDVQVGAKCLETGIWGAYRNVLINLPQIEDEGHRKQLRDEAEAMVELASKNCGEILEILEQKKD